MTLDSLEILRESFLALQSHSNLQAHFPLNKEKSFTRSLWGLILANEICFQLMLVATIIRVIIDFDGNFWLNENKKALLAYPNALSTDEDLWYRDMAASLQ